MDKEELQQRSLKFAVDVQRLAVKLIAVPTARGTANQLLDASQSVAANYRAACRGRSRAEFIAKLGVVVEECDESVMAGGYARRQSDGDASGGRSAG